MIIDSQSVDWCCVLDSWLYTCACDKCQVLMEDAIRHAAVFDTSVCANIVDLLRHSHSQNTVLYDVSG